MPKQHIKADGANLMRLVSKFGTARAANLIGMSTSGIANVKSRGQCGYAYDELARMILEQEEETGGAHLWMVKVPDDKVEMLSTFLGALHIKFARFKE